MQGETPGQHLGRFGQLGRVIFSWCWVLLAQLVHCRQLLRMVRED